VGFGVPVTERSRRSRQVIEVVNKGSAPFSSERNSALTQVLTVARGFRGKKQIRNFVEVTMRYVRRDGFLQCPKPLVKSQKHLRLPSPSMLHCLLLYTFLAVIRPLITFSTRFCKET